MSQKRARSNDFEMEDVGTAPFARIPEHGPEKKCRRLTNMDSVLARPPSNTTWQNPGHPSMLPISRPPFNVKNNQIRSPPKARELLCKFRSLDLNTRKRGRSADWAPEGSGSPVAKRSRPVTPEDSIRRPESFVFHNRDNPEVDEWRLTLEQSLESARSDTTAPNPSPPRNGQSHAAGKPQLSLEEADFRRRAQKGRGRPLCFPNHLPRQNVARMECGNACSRLMSASWLGRQVLEAKQRKANRAFNAKYFLPRPMLALPPAPKMLALPPAPSPSRDDGDVDMMVEDTGPQSTRARDLMMEL